MSESFWKSTLRFTRERPLSPRNARCEGMIPESRKAMPTPEPSTPGLTTAPAPRAS